MRIIVDAFGGDNAPVSVLQGCAMAAREHHVDLALSGDKETIALVCRENRISLPEDMPIFDAPDVIGMEEEPDAILKSKTRCSMAEGLRRLAAGDGDAFVSAGSTGALVMGATFLTGRIKGIKRAALAPFLPTTERPYLLMDVGANVDCRPEMLLQFGVMGSLYAGHVIGVQRPRVGLLNIGAEESKGGEMRTEAFRLLQNAPIHFVGNVEARSLPTGICDVVVADGFSGNIVLKLTEGLASAMFGMMRASFQKNLKTKIAASLMMPELKSMAKYADYAETGGAPLLGVAKPVIKAHGSSNAKAIMNAILQAKKFAESGMIAELSRLVAETK